MKKLKLSMFQIYRVEIGMAMIVIGFTTFMIGVIMLITNYKNFRKYQDDNNELFPISEDDIKIYQHPMVKPGSWCRAVVFINTPRGYKSALFEDNNDFIMDEKDYITSDTIKEMITDFTDQGYRKIDTALYRKNYGIYLEGECTKKKNENDLKDFCIIC